MSILEKESTLSYLYFWKAENPAQNRNGLGGWGGWGGLSDSSLIMQLLLS